MKSLDTPFDHNGECLYCDELGEHAPECPAGLWAAWVASRPPQIQAAIKHFPPASILEHAGETLHLLGWSEVKDSDEVTLIFSVIDPLDDYEAAQRPEHKRYICAHHLKPAGA